MLARNQAAYHHPPTPSYIFRGHTAGIHALHFLPHNHFFVSGDADGWVIIWRLTTRRAAAVWKAHDGIVSGLKHWSSSDGTGTRLITHGRDHKLRVWQLPKDDQSWNQLSTELPVDSVQASEEQKQPWLVHSMDVNALNFCAFSICLAPEVRSSQEARDYHSLLVASPNAVDNGGIDIFQLPSEVRVSKLQADKAANTGMVMTLRIIQSSNIEKLMLVVGYEDGSVAVYARKDQNVMPVWIWERLMLNRVHMQPVLSLDIELGHDFLVTSSADATLAKFPLPKVKVVGKAEASKVVATKHSGQQDLKIRGDGRIFATAGWDKHVRVYSAKTLKELAVLQWHREGCYALAFANISVLGEPAAAPKKELIEARSGLEKMKQERDEKVHNTHWLIAGSKDGKISLWDVY